MNSRAEEGGASAAGLGGGQAGDDKAFGDNIGGVFLWIPLLVFTALQYFYFNPKLLSRG